VLTTILAILLSAVGIAGIIAGAYRLVKKGAALPDRAFETAVAVASIAGGLGLLGLAQALRLLLVINGKMPS
jgi:hypothetical protein